MPDERPELTAAEAEAKSKAAPKDLRAKQEADLKSEFTANLLAAGTLPKAACDSLVALLGASGPIPADVIAALGLEDGTQAEAPNE